MAIESVTIYLDRNLPEYMLGVKRIGAVVSVDENGCETYHNELVDNKEYSEEDSCSSMISDVAKALNVDESIVSIENDEEDLI
jgi:hypothetical protein